jgi:hypothetical protein
MELVAMRLRIGNTAASVKPESWRITVSMA